MAWDVHEMQVGFTDELDFWGVEEAVVVFADEAGVFDGFLGEFADVGCGADDSHVIRIRGLFLVRESNMLANQHTYTYTGHVEAVEEGLDIGVNLHALFLAFVFEDSLSDGCDNAVVSSFDAFEGLGEAFVVVVELRRPVAAVVSSGEIAS